MVLPPQLPLMVRPLGSLAGNWPERVATDQSRFWPSASRLSVRVSPATKPATTSGVGPTTCPTAKSKPDDNVPVGADGHAQTGEVGRAKPRQYLTGIAEALDQCAG